MDSIKCSTGNSYTDRDNKNCSNQDIKFHTFVTTETDKETKFKAEDAEHLLKIFTRKKQNKLQEDAKQIRKLL